MIGSNNVYDVKCLRDVNVLSGTCCHLGGVKEDLGGVRRSLRGGVRLSLVLRPPRTDLLTALENSVTEGFFSVADSLRFWFLRAVLKLSSRWMSVLMTAITD